eukprot:gene17795-19572_t
MSFGLAVYCVVVRFFLVWLDKHNQNRDAQRLDEDKNAFKRTCVRARTSRDKAHVFKTSKDEEKETDNCQGQRSTADEHIKFNTGKITGKSKVYIFIICSNVQAGLCRRRKAAGEIRNSRCHRIDAIIDRRRGGQLLHHLKPKPVGKKPGRFVAHDRRSFSKSVVLIERIAQDLAMRGFSVIDHFAGETLVDAILRDVFQLYFQKHKFNPGTLSADCSQNARDKQKVRGDMVMWLDTNTNSTTHAAVRSAEMSMSELVHGLNGTDILHGSIIRSRSSVMAACYPGNGAGYKRHVDNPSNDGRKLTSILYLNKDYNRARDGGVLRMYPRNDDRHYDIDPTGGRLVLFWSDHRNPHEVLPSYWERFAISVWYFDIIERARSFVKSFQTCQLTK